MALVLAAVKEALAGRYKVERALGRGGMAAVFLAHESTAHGDRHIAIKVLRPEYATTIGPERFHREVRFLSKFSHPNVLPLLTSGEAGGMLYLVTPYAPGDTLRTMLARLKQLSLDRVVGIARDLAAGLDYIHANNVIHRDIKPENIVFAEDRALLCDFGVARAIVAAADERISSSGLVLGTPDYMSPEQVEGKSNLDHRTDIYSFACVVYEMLVGEAPFTGRSRQAVMARQAKEPPPSVRVVRPDVPKRVEEALRQALAKEPRDRPESAGGFVRLFDAAP